MPDWVQDARVASSRSSGRSTSRSRRSSATCRTRSSCAALGMQLLWIADRARRLLARLAVRDPALLGGRGLTMTHDPGRAGCYLQVGVLNELQYRVNFFVQAPPVADRGRDRARRARARLLAHDGAERLDAARAPLRPRHPDPAWAGVIRTVDPAEHDAADRGGAAREARLRAHEARGRAGARERARGAHLAGRGRRLGGDRPRRRRSSRIDGRRRRRSTRSPSPSRSLLGAVLIYCFWLVLATGAFWVVRMWHAAELFDGIFQTGRWPVGIYPPWLRFGVTFLVPIAFAVTVPARGAHVAARLADARCSRSSSRSRCSRSRAGSGASACGATRVRPP